RHTALFKNVTGPGSSDLGGWPALARGSRVLPRQGWRADPLPPALASGVLTGAGASDREKVQQHQGSARNRSSTRRRVNAVKLPLQAADSSWERLFQGEHVYKIRPSQTLTPQASCRAHFDKMKAPRGYGWVTNPGRAA